MTIAEEREMHELAIQLEVLTRGDGWALGQYAAIARVLTTLTEYCAVCACQHQTASARDGW